VVIGNMLSMYYTLATIPPPVRPGADMRKNSIRRVEFPTHPVHALVCGDRSAEWVDSRVVSVLDSGAVGPGLKSQPRRFR